MDSYFDMRILIEIAWRRARLVEFEGEGIGI